MGNRASILDVAKYCGQAGKRSIHAAGRSAAMSSARHALGAQSPNAQSLYMSLSEEEREIVNAWKTPSTVVVDGQTLDYASAEKEVELGLDKDGSYAEGSYAIGIGHIDMGWVRQCGDRQVAFVGDLKRSVYTSANGPDSLQLAFYGLAYASLHQCDGYIPGIWALEESVWEWGTYVDLTDLFGADRIIGEVVHAILNDGPAVTGPHCQTCYARTHCPEYCLPAVDPHSWIAPLMEGGTGLTRDNALEILIKWQAIKTVVKVVETALKTYASSEGGIRDGAGKVWAPTERPGQESCDVERLRQALGDEADKYIVQGKPYMQYRWRKDKI